RYFSFIITRADAEPKPSPDGLNKILDKFGQTSAVYIGDSAVDYEAAQNAGIDFIGYKTNIEGVNSISKHSEIFKFLSRQRLPF
ncbi:MAG: HAD family hydrolase, partial [Deferribacteraceae bacterium]|nr:HAD family hydrolase [Deferribacteraceae bacterium]